MEASVEQLRHDMTKAARLTFGVYKQQHPDEEFYAFALYTDGSAGGANCAASSEHSLRRATQKYVDKGYTIPESGHLRYIPDEWAYSGAEGSIDEWVRIWELNEALKKSGGVSFLRYKQIALETMILSLKDLDSEGFFGTGADRERITLLIWITDSSDAIKWWNRSIKELNPKAVYERVLAEAPSWCK